MNEDLAPLPSLADLAADEQLALRQLRNLLIIDNTSDEDRVYAAATLLEHVRDRYAAWSSE